MVVDAVNNNVICALPVTPGQGTCDDMATVRKQVAETRKLQAFIDEQYGGPGSGRASSPSSSAWRSPTRSAASTSSTSPAAPAPTSTGEPARRPPGLSRGTALQPPRLDGPGGVRPQGDDEAQDARRARPPERQGRRPHPRPPRGGGRPRRHLQPLVDGPDVHRARLQARRVHHPVRPRRGPLRHGGRDRPRPAREVRQGLWHGHGHERLRGDPAPAEGRRPEGELPVQGLRRWFVDARQAGDRSADVGLQHRRCRPLRDGARLGGEPPPDRRRGARRRARPRLADLPDDLGRDRDVGPRASTSPRRARPRRARRSGPSWAAAPPTRPPTAGPTPAGRASGRRASGGRPTSVSSARSGRSRSSGRTRTPRTTASRPRSTVRRGRPRGR